MTLLTSKARPEAQSHLEYGHGSIRVLLAGGER